MQTILNFEETGGRLKITTATFWRPSGRNLNKASTGGKDEEDWGVKPDKGYDMPLAAKAEPAKPSGAATALMPMAK